MNILNLTKIQISFPKNCEKAIKFCCHIIDPFFILLYSKNNDISPYFFKQQRLTQIFQDNNYPYKKIEIEKIFDQQVQFINSIPISNKKSQNILIFVRKFNFCLFSYRKFSHVIITKNNNIEDNVSRKLLLMNLQSPKKFQVATDLLLPIYQYFSTKNLYIDAQTQKIYQARIVKLQREKQGQFLEVCKWRKCTHLPIVSISSVKMQKQVQNKLCAIIFVENVAYRLQKVQNLSLQQQLYLLKYLLPALQQLVIKFGNFQVNAKNIIIDHQNQAKLWINQKLEQCYANKLFDNQSQTILSFIDTIFNKSLTKKPIFSSKELITFQKLKCKIQKIQKQSSYIPNEFVAQKKIQRQVISENRYHNRSVSLNYEAKSPFINQDKNQNFFKFRKRFQKRRGKKFLLLQKIKESKQNTTEAGSNHTKYSIDESSQNINRQNWSQISQNCSHKDMAISLYKNLYMNQKSKQNTQGSFQFRPATHKKYQSNLQALYSNNSEICTVKRNSNFLFQQKKKIADWFRDGDFAISMKKMQESKLNLNSSIISNKFDSEEEDQINQNVQHSEGSLKMILNCCQINSVSSVNSVQSDKKLQQKNKNIFQKWRQLIVQSLVEPQQDQYHNF